MIKVEDASSSIKRGIITRTINPKWLDAMITHGYNGVTKIADRIEYMLGLSATIGHIEDWMWNSVTENIFFNKERAKKMKDANIFAYRKIIRRLLEEPRISISAPRKRALPEKRSPRASSPPYL